MRREQEFQRLIASKLASAGIQFDREVITGGFWADFVVHAAAGKRYVIEAKAWSKKPGFQARAAHQARLIQEAAEADRAFVVVEGLQRSDLEGGALTVESLVPTLKTLLAQDIGLEKPTVSRIGEPACSVFAAMPFDEKYDDVFFVAMVFACKQCDLVCTRIDLQEFSGNVVQEIQSRIRDSVAVIADLSESNSNVLYEVGFSHAIKKPTVHICSTPLSKLPFDVAHWNTLRYSVGQTHALRRPLTRRLQSVLPTP